MIVISSLAFLKIARRNSLGLMSCKVHWSPISKATLLKIYTILLRRLHKPPSPTTYLPQTALFRVMYSEHRKLIQLPCTKSTHANVLKKLKLFLFILTNQLFLSISLSNNVFSVPPKTSSISTSWSLLFPKYFAFTINFETSVTKRLIMLQKISLTCGLVMIELLPRTFSSLPMTRSTG